VLPASGVALCWLLLMTLWLPALDYARSYRPLVERLARHVPRNACISGAELPRGQVVALEFMGRYRVDALHDANVAGCPYLMRLEHRNQPLPTPAGEPIGTTRSGCHFAWRARISSTTSESPASRYSTRFPRRSVSTRRARRRICRWRDVLAKLNLVRAESSSTLRMPWAMCSSNSSLWAWESARATSAKLAKIACLGPVLDTAFSQ